MPLPFFPIPTEAMKAKTHQISWHYDGDEPKPVFAADFSAEAIVSDDGTTALRLATAGADRTVKLWKIIESVGCDTSVSFLAELRHQSSVNCVRFSPDGAFLASADDDGLIMLWQRDVQHEATASSGNMMAEEAPDQVEHWRTIARLRRHQDDVYDLCWSPNGSQLLSGSVDNSAIVWSMASHSPVQVIKDHKSYVQGVAWSARGSQLLTLSADRTARVYNLKHKKKSSSFVLEACLSTHEVAAGEEEPTQAADASAVWRVSCCNCGQPVDNMCSRTKASAGPSYLWT